MEAPCIATTDQNTRAIARSHHLTQDLGRLRLSVRNSPEISSRSSQCFSDPFLVRRRSPTKVPTATAPALDNRFVSPARPVISTRTPNAKAKPSTATAMTHRLARRCAIRAVLAPRKTPAAAATRCGKTALTTLPNTSPSTAAPTDFAVGRVLQAFGINLLIPLLHVLLSHLLARGELAPGCQPSTSSPLVVVVASAAAASTSTTAGGRGCRPVAPIAGRRELPVRRVGCDDYSVLVNDSDGDLRKGASIHAGDCHCTTNRHSRSPADAISCGDRPACFPPNHLTCPHSLVQ